MIGLVFIPFLVRFLGPEKYGKYAFILSVFAMANILLTSGTNDAVRKFISEKDDNRWQNAVFGGVARPATIIAVVVATIFVLGASSGFVERILGPEYVLSFYILSIYAIGRQCREYLIRTLMGLQLENFSEPLKVFQDGLFAFLALSAAYFGYGVEGILIADIVTSFVVATAAALLLNKHLNLSSVVSPPDVSLPANIYPYIGSTVLFFGFLMSLYHVDVLLLQYWTSETTVGYYKGSLVIVERLWFVPVVIQLALLQRISKLWANDDLEKIQRQASQVTRLGLLFTLLVTIGMAALADDFIRFYLGSEFEPAVTPLLLLLPGVIGFAAARPTLAINQGRQSLRPLIIATAMSSLINLLLNTVLIPHYGMYGAAIATSFGYGSLSLFQAMAARHVGYKPFYHLPVVRIIATCVITAIPVFGMSTLIGSALVSLLVVPIVGLITFVATAIVTGAIKQREVQYGVNALQLVITRFRDPRSV
ncbi:polysaccharide biosynthesis protein [Natrialba chahannaoensis JCM 10990]|uniref:Polysaccharide biosynthesis protein n=2 Tax=Natrialba chahannaoensis TaxID=68911 RepID=M0A568_9EURY|nr:polysaccharide biosynthesis protein [Natrialba chahannaoensis JCM 10990]